MRPIEVVQMSRDLQAHGRLAGALFTEHHRRRGFARLPEDLVPRRMVGVVDAVLLEHWIRLGILLREWISRDAVMFQELLYLHPFVISIFARGREARESSSERM